MRLSLRIMTVAEEAVEDVVVVEAAMEVVVAEALVTDLELSNASIAKVKVTCLENAQSPKKSVNQEVMAMDLVSSSASTAKVRVTCLENVLNQRRSVNLEAMEMDQESLNAITARVKVTCPESVLSQRKNAHLKEETTMTASQVNVVEMMMEALSDRTTMPMVVLPGTLVEAVVTLAGVLMIKKVALMLQLTITMLLMKVAGELLLKKMDPKALAMRKKPKVEVEVGMTNHLVNNLRAMTMQEEAGEQIHSLLLYVSI